VIAAPYHCAGHATRCADKPNVRVLELGDSPPRTGSNSNMRSVTGGLLAQTATSAGSTRPT
jgi:AICAR transformylase/IMP cyclohydrolase PurH